MISAVWSCRLSYFGACEVCIKCGSGTASASQSEASERPWRKVVSEDTLLLDWLSWLMDLNKRSQTN